jgi:acyl-CoA thioester hydrolase
MADYRFTLDFEVRDYECDLQGIVNNAVYQNYLEHTRHLFLKSEGIDFAELTRRGIHLVVVRVELDYLYSLRSGDRFAVGLNTRRVSPLRFEFLQDIHRLPDRKRILKGRVVGVALNEESRPFVPEEVERVWGEVSDRGS